MFDGLKRSCSCPTATSKSGNSYPWSDWQQTHHVDGGHCLDTGAIVRYVQRGLPAFYSTRKAHGAVSEMFIYGFLAVLPKIIVSYVVGLGIEFVVLNGRRRKFRKGSGIGILIRWLFQLTVRCGFWLWLLHLLLYSPKGIRRYGMNVFNVALVTRAFCSSLIRRRCRVMPFGYRATASSDWVNR